jgi:hypothetical protein
MSPISLVTELLRNLNQQRLRSFLTIFGIMWGTATLILLLAFGAGFRDQTVLNMRGMGDEIAIMFPGRTTVAFEGYGIGRPVRFRESDAWMLHTDSESPNCAYAWMNMTSTAEVNGQIAMNFGMAPANLAFCESSNEAREHCDFYNADDEDYFSKVWYWVTPIDQCLDGRTDVKCTDFSQWTDAWASVKG